MATTYTNTKSNETVTTERSKAELVQQFLQTAGDNNWLWYWIAKHVERGNGPVARPRAASAPVAAPKPVPAKATRPSTAGPRPAAKPEPVYYADVPDAQDELYDVALKDTLLSNGVFIVEASDIGGGARPEQTLRVKGKNGVQTFSCIATNKDGEGDITHWTYTNPVKTVTLVVLND